MIFSESERPLKGRLKCRFSRQTPADAMTPTSNSIQNQSITANIDTIDLPTVDHCSTLSLQIFQPF